MSNKNRFFGALVGMALLTAVATPSSAFVLVRDTQNIFPGKWGPSDLGTGATVTYSFMATGVTIGEPDSGLNAALADIMPGGFEAVVTNAFNAWSEVANISFSQVADNGKAFDAPGATGDIRLGAHAFETVPEGVILAHGFFPPVNGFSAAGDIHFNTAVDWDLGFAGAGFSLFQVLTHEIGHAIGLDHEDSPGVIALMNSLYTEDFSGLQADDIAGAQFIYGAAIGGPDPAAVIPLPAALPLFGSALAVIGVLGWRRNHRKSAT